VEFRILGPVEVRADATEIPLGGPKLRALLAILVLRANEVVSRDRLIEGLWGERAPPAASHTLDDYVSRLRKTLGPERIETRPPGYRLRLKQGELDLERFETLYDEGRRALAEGAPAQALEALDAALALWRGRALADVVFQPVGQADAERLEGRRLQAVEQRMDAALALGRDGELVAELEGLVDDHPFRERLLYQLMLALYRSGRQAEALAAFQAARQRFAGELGLEPGPLLRDLEQRILTHDPGLGRPEPPTPRREVPRPRRGARRPPAAAIIAAGVGALGALIALAAGIGGSAPRVVAGPPRLVAVDADTGDVAGDVTLRGAPAAMAVAGRSLWLADANGGTVSQVDVAGGGGEQRITLGGSPGVVAVAGGSVWVAGVPGETVTRIDRQTEAVTQTVRLSGASTSALGSGAGGLWVADTANDRLIRIDAATGDVGRTIDLELDPTALVIGAGAIWVADYRGHAVAEVDARSGETLVSVNVGKGPVALAVGEDGVWVANALDSTVSRIDPAGGTVVATIPVDSGPVALAATSGSVWVASEHPGTVSEIDPRRNAVVRRRSVAGTPTSMAAADGRLWLGVRPGIPPGGGKLVLVRQGPISIDPGAAAQWSPFQSTGLVHDGLVTFNHVGGPSGLQIVPDLALSLPIPTDAGKTYTFRLRPDIRYSDGRPLRAADFRRGIERSFILRSLDRDLFDAIAGADACLAPGAIVCNLAAGIVTDEAARTVTFHLTRSDPQFLSTLTNGGFAMPVPAGTPMRRTGFRPIPGTGPYKVASADRHHIRYVRNSRFREWSHAAQPAGEPDEIIWRFGLAPGQQVKEIQQGHADWMGDPVPGDLRDAVKTQFASQVHTYPSTDTEFLQFNTRRAPFDDVRVRKAVNLAIDRNLMVALQGGTDVADPTCQLLPPGVPGHRRYCPYTSRTVADGAWSGPDLARARRLVRASGTRSDSVTVWGWTDDPYAPPRIARHAASVLRKLGYRTRVRLVTHEYLAEPPARVFAGIQLGPPTGWTDVSAYNFFAPWLSCNGAGAHGWFCDRGLDRLMRRASRLETTAPRASATLWTRIDRELVDRAALVPYVNLRQTDFISRRVNNLQHHPYLGPLVDQLRLRRR
jgi:YVTN family beta-propeller protein